MIQSVTIKDFKLMDYLNKPESGLMLGLFRLAFGLIMFYHIYLHWTRIETYKISDHLRFPYPELDWVPLFSYEGLLIVFFVGLISAVLFTIGFLYRYSAVLLFTTYSYLFSLDALYYNNHYYLLALISFLMIFCDADARLSLIKERSKVPSWNYLILQLQICIVFFYGGLSKINKDWLGGYTLGGEEFTFFQNLFLGWGGMLFDLLIPFLLLYRRSRWMAIGLVLLFNISNHFLFDDIAGYPLLASLSMLLFLEGSNKLERVLGLFAKAPKLELPIKLNSGLKFTLAVYFVLQLAYPLRHLVIPGHPEWTGQGHYFAWRMKSYQKQVKLDVFAYDRETKTRRYRLKTGLDDYQIQRIGGMPHMILTFGNHMRSKLEKMDGKDENLGISVDYRASLNKLPEVLAIDPNIDLTQIQFNTWRKNQWIQSKPKRKMTSTTSG